MEGVQLAFGMMTDGQIVSIEQVQRGLKCECVCPKCRERVVAHQGPKYAWHFSHYNPTNCSGGRETALHLFAKQLICKTLQCSMPDPIGRIVSASQEYRRLADIRPDVFVELDSGEKVAIEICVEHPKSESDIDKYRRLFQPAIEIDLEPYRYIEMGWEKAILFEAKRVWLCMPERVRLAKQEVRRLALEAASREEARRWNWVVPGTDKVVFKASKEQRDDLPALLGKFGLGLIKREEFWRRMELGGWTDADIDAYCEKEAKWYP